MCRGTDHLSNFWDHNILVNIERERLINTFTVVEQAVSGTSLAKVELLLKYIITIKFACFWLQPDQNFIDTKENWNLRQHSDKQCIKFYLTA